MKPVFINNSKVSRVARSINLVRPLTDPQFSLIKTCRSCGMGDGTTNTIPVGSNSSKFVFITDYPRSIEASNFKCPISTESPSGKIFEMYLAALNLNRPDVYITSALHCGLRFHKKISYQWVDACSVWKYKEFQDLKNVKFVFLLGKPAFNQFLPPHIIPQSPHMDVNFRMFDIDIFGRLVKVVTLPHHALIVRYPSLKESVISRLEIVRQVIYGCVRDTKP